jgi:hypothetical protein
MQKLASFLMSNLELVLAGMSIPVITVIHLLVSPHFDNPWKITAAAALAVGVLHSALGWMVRARQRTVRVELLQRIWGILQKDLMTAPPPIASQTFVTAPEDPANQAVRLALAQFPALLREPVAIRTMPFPASFQQNPPEMRSGLQT